MSHSGKLGTGNAASAIGSKRIAGRTDIRAVEGGWLRGSSTRSLSLSEMGTSPVDEGVLAREGATLAGSRAGTGLFGLPSVGARGLRLCFSVAPTPTNGNSA